MSRVRALLILLCFASAPAFATSTAEVPNPRSHGLWVSDIAGVISDADENAINQKIDALEKQIGVEIAVVTVDVAAAATPKDFATELFNLWGIGKSDKNNGVLVLLVKGARRLEIETGYGVESVLPDGWLKSMQMREMVPAFKRGDFSGGLKAGVFSMSSRLIEYKDGISESIANPGRVSESESDAPWFALFGAGGVASVGGAVAYRRKKKRTCPECNERLELLSETEDDEKLNEGQRVEERIGSVDYQFWYCKNDGHTRLDRIDKWFSGFSRCKSCGHKTLKVTSTTVRRATTLSTGSQRVVESCRHCDYRNEHHRVLPRVRPTSVSTSGGGGFSSGGSSSSSSSGGSFGGGSSGGGGAGSSW